MRHLWVIVLAGCYSTVPIRPSEVEKINDMFVSYGMGGIVSPGGPGIAPSVSVGTVETDRSHIDFVEPDGTIENVPGYADLILTTKARTYRFKEIVHVEDEGDRFMLRSSSRTGEIPKADIVSTELRQLDRVKTVLAIGGVTIGLTIPVMIFALTR